MSEHKRIEHIIEQQRLISQIIVTQMAVIESLERRVETLEGSNTGRAKEDG